MSRVLVVDIETAPILAYTWKTWKTDISPGQVVRDGYILCFAAKWLGEREIFFARVEHDANGNPKPASRRAMLTLAHKLLSEADAVVHYNGVAFDIPWFYREFMEFSFAPPPPFDDVDLLLAMRRARFSSNKLEQIARRLDVGAKVAHEGFSLWPRCMADDPVAWRKMKAYNQGDVRLTERLYKRILAWIPRHPNLALIDGVPNACTRCKSKDWRREGIRWTKAYGYQRFQCRACGAWDKSKSRIPLPGTDRRQA